MHWSFDKDITVADLIEIQRSFARAQSTSERVVGTLWAAGTLDKRLAQLTDPQIGQLLSNFVYDQLGIFEPEMTICKQATRRLFRSTAGKLTPEEAESVMQRNTCLKCGSEMLLHVGIDEPDFFECVRLSCQLARGFSLFQK
jgi:hypothetical protein